MVIQTFVQRVMALVLVTLIPPLAYGQLTGQISGTITDTSGAVVPGVDVTVVNEATGIKRNVKTNQDGIYTVPLLQPGGYSINAQVQGFRSLSRTGIQLQVAQSAQLDLKMEVGATSESINVVETAPL